MCTTGRCLCSGPRWVCACEDLRWYSFVCGEVGGVGGWPFLVFSGQTHGIGKCPGYGGIGAAAAAASHSHSKASSKLHLGPAPYLKAILDPGIAPAFSPIRVRFIPM